MGLFDQFEGDFEDIPQPSFGVPVGTWEAILSGVSTETKEDSGKTFLIFTYTVTQEGPAKGKTQKEYKQIVIGRPQNDKDVEAMGYVKARLSDFGVPPERMNTLDPDDLIGTEVAITVVPQKNNPQYNQVTRVVRLDQANPVPTLPSAAAASPEVAAKADDDNPFA